VRSFTSPMRREGLAGVDFCRWRAAHGRAGTPKGLSDNNRCIRWPRWIEAQAHCWTSQQWHPLRGNTSCCGRHVPESQSRREGFPRHKRSSIGACAAYAWTNRQSHHTPRDASRVCAIEYLASEANTDSFSKERSVLDNFAQRGSSHSQGLSAPIGRPAGTTRRSIGARIRSRGETRSSASSR
jgi:hypothetical protein